MFTLRDILEANQGQLSLHPEAAIAETEQIFQSAQHDSRVCTAADLFVAISGAHVDGHRFLPELAQRGVRAALCSVFQPDLPATFLQLVVPDVIHALQATARLRVQRQPETIKIGITGSSGKTTTKEAIAAVLSASAPTLKTYASYNNELGYPLTLLQLEPEQRYAVLEMGAERVGELRGLSETVVRPDWSVITIVGAAHLKHFGSPENVAIAKSELVQVLREDGIAFLNYDDVTVRAMSAKTRARVIFYGWGEGATVRAQQVEERGLLGSRFLLNVGEHEQPVTLQLPGRHGVTTALAAAAVGYAAQIPLPTIIAALEALAPVKNRGGLLHGAGPNGSTLVNDTYNAMRQSVLAMAQALQATPLPPEGKRWAILSELLEQGEYSMQEHLLAGQGLVGKVDYLVALGDFARYFVEGAQQAGLPAEQTFFFSADPDDAVAVEEKKREIASLLKARVAPQDLLLLKGSRAMRMETLIPLLSS